MSINILFSDRIHFHDNNFKSLFSAIKKKNYEFEFNEEHQDWISLYGDYSSKFPFLQSHYQLLSHLTREQLINYSLRNINIYEVAKSELLAYLLPQKAMYKLEISDEKKNIFDYIYENHRNDLILNMSASLFWLDFWYEKIVTNQKTYTHVFTFSGSNIYAKSLIKVCQLTSTRVFVTETSLTGNDYYIEERLSHISNNSDIKNIAVRKKYLKEVEVSGNKQNLKIKAINKLNLANNKNVVQPYSDSNDIEFDNNKRVVVIIGQVVNDYSIIESEFGWVSSISLYEKMIDNILNCTDYNIIFKSHPWECKKTHCHDDITYNEISRYKNELGIRSKRLKVVKNYNIDLLLSNSQYVVTINSQAGLEAARHGIKPIIFGDVFYGAFGFTYDCNSLDDLIFYIQNEYGSLTLSEYEKFEEFITIYLEMHLFSIHPSGETKAIQKIFTNSSLIKLIDKPKLNNRMVNVSNAQAQENEQELPCEEEVISNIAKLSSVTKIKNGVIYFFTDFEKFKKKIKARV